jgi:hypothetical protein
MKANLRTYCLAAWIFILGVIFVGCVSNSDKSTPSLSADNLLESPALSPTTVGPTPPRTLSPAVQSRPEFVIGVSPEEGSAIPVKIYEHVGAEQPVGLHSRESGYATTVCVDFSLSPLVQRGDNLVDTISIQERVELVIDGWTAGDVTSGIVWGPEGEAGPRDNPDTFWSERQTYCWHAPLDVGIHQARFRFHQTSGELREYAWHFTITD